MKRLPQKLSRPRHGTVVAYMALFVALGGTSYALTIGTEDVPKNALTGADIKSLTARDFKGGEVAVDSDPVKKSFTVSQFGTAAAFVPCPKGEVVTGGGYGNDLSGLVDGSFPFFDQGWFVQVAGAPPGLQFLAYAVCVPGVADKN